MKKWLYKQVVVEERHLFSKDPVQDALDRMGEKGWELRASYRSDRPMAPPVVVLIFCKEAEEEGPQTLCG